MFPLVVFDDVDIKKRHTDVRSFFQSANVWIQALMTACFNAPTRTHSGRQTNSRLSWYLMYEVTPYFYFVQLFKRNTIFLVKVG